MGSKIIGGEKVSAQSPKLIVTVKLYDVQADQLYLIGNVAALGAWDATKSKKMTKKGDVFTTSIPAKFGEMIEFKIACKPSWCNVEKGMFGEELPNHAVLIELEETTVEIGVSNFSEF